MESQAITLYQWAPLRVRIERLIVSDNSYGTYMEGRFGGIWGRGALSEVSMSEGT